MSLPPKILVGTAGWSHNDWEGVVYPQGMQRRREHPLTYLAQYFDMVEISASFYGYIKPEWTRVWARRVDVVKPNFRFTAKLHHSFTHAAPDMPGPTSAASIKPTRENEARVRAGFDSLASIGKLSVIVAQFPLSYRNTPLNREYLQQLAEWFKEYSLVIEVRDESWDNPDTLRYLKDLKIGFCNIDWVPTRASLQETEFVTSAAGYACLHGREAKHDYLYRVDELKKWAQKIWNIARASDVTYVVTNNSPGAKSVVAALQLQYLLTGKTASLPESLLRQFPQLREISGPMEEEPKDLSA